ncbi:hypothetical protein E2562_032407, partial [Oryza meyeriana var. granulata]
AVKGKGKATCLIPGIASHQGEEEEGGGSSGDAACASGGGGVRCARRRGPRSRGEEPGWRRSGGVGKCRCREAEIAGDVGGDGRPEPVPTGRTGRAAETYSSPARETDRSASSSRGGRKGDGTGDEGHYICWLTGARSHCTRPIPWTEVNSGPAHQNLGLRPIWHVSNPRTACNASP